MNLRVARVLSMVPIAIGVGVGACASERVYNCDSDSQCKRDSVNGACLAPGFCVFSDSNCPEGLRWDSTAGDDLADQCVTAGGGNGTPNACGGTTVLPSLPGTACGICDSGVTACDGQEAVLCNGEFTLEQEITSQGSVNASSVFSGSFAPSLSIDGDLSTSWFSSGPESGVPNGTSTYSWNNSADRCIKSVVYVGNEFHSNSDFRTDFGFDQLTVEVRDASDTVIFSKIESLVGTPDPQITVEIGGVLGRSVHLKLGAHESSDCGGFSELTVNALL